MIETPRTTRISDELLDALAAEYQMLGLKHLRIEFHQFVAMPDHCRSVAAAAEAIAAHLVQRLVEGHDFLPLLPRQRVVQDRLDQEELEAEVEAAERDLLRERPDTRCRGGTFTEPLHHHAYGHDRRRSFFRRQGGKS